MKMPKEVDENMFERVEYVVLTVTSVKPGGFGRLRQLADKC